MKEPADIPELRDADRFQSTGIPKIWADRIHDDTEALQALFDGMPVEYKGRVIGPTDDWIVMHEQFLISGTIDLRECGQRRRGFFSYNILFPPGGFNDDSPPIYYGSDPLDA